ncbi:hypothetical protein [Rhodoplanes azumiensis]|uniref:DUF2933 domain-containing protein n=1 Tax=Rhodoplanes azumiensis TaxID=1897628 RepID=A0ABW5AJ00_9BRAD
MRAPDKAVRQWRWPIVLAVSTLVGLLAALIGGGGVWWAVSWAALASPLVVLVVCLIPHDRRAASGLPPLRRTELTPP